MVAVGSQSTPTKPTAPAIVYTSNVSSGRTEALGSYTAFHIATVSYAA